MNLGTLLEIIVALIFIYLASKPYYLRIPGAIGRLARVSG
jgi:hypothetical protein